jgi:zinc/manganese transport system ATP-binding protein
LIAYLPQTLALQGRFPLTVNEFVGFGFDRPGLNLAWLAGGSRGCHQAIRQALQRTGCADLGDRLLSELSGGQLKRVLLAFCVVSPRQLLVLELRRQEGWTVLQVSHDLEMVRRSCEQVLCLNRLLYLYGPNAVPFRHQHNHASRKRA